jgi:biotin carboxylase
MSQPVIIYLNLRRTHLEHGAVIEAAHRQGYGVALIADHVPPGLPRQVVRVVHQVDTYDPVAVDAAVDAVTAEHPVAGVVTWSDRDVETVSRIAARLGLPAPPLAAARIARNKFLMREALAGHPDVIPRFARVTEWSELVKAVAEIGYPAVLKPTSGSGSKGIFVLRGEDDLRAAFDELIRYTRPEVDRVFFGNPNELIVEEFLTGTEHSVEGLVSDGVVHIVGVTDKETSEPFRLEVAHVYPSVLPAGTLAKIGDLTRLVVGTIGLDNCAFHLECMVDARQTVKLVEIAARVGGDFITSHLVGLSSGRPFSEDVIRVAVGEPPLPAGDPRWHAGIRKIMADRDGVLEGLDGLERALAVPGVRHIAMDRPVGATVRTPPADYTTGTLGAVIAVGDTAEAVRATLQTAVAAVTPRIRPADSDV